MASTKQIKEEKAQITAMLNSLGTGYRAFTLKRCTDKKTDESYYVVSVYRIVRTPQAPTTGHSGSWKDLLPSDYTMINDKYESLSIVTPLKLIGIVRE